MFWRLAIFGLVVFVLTNLSIGLTRKALNRLSQNGMTLEERVHHVEKLSELLDEPNRSKKPAIYTLQ